MKIYQTLKIQALKIAELEKQNADLRLQKEQKLEIYKAWNKADAKRISELIKENKDEVRFNKKIKEFITKNKFNIEAQDGTKYVAIDYEELDKFMFE